MAENVAPSPAKRARKPNFTPAECAVIFEQAEENIDVIKSKFSSTLTNKNKSRVWDDITTKVNALGVCKRDVIDVKEKWRSMVSLAKKEHNKCAVSRKKTGGGRQPDSPKGTTLKIIQLFEEDPAFSDISGGVDSAQPLESTISVEVLNELLEVSERNDTNESSGQCPAVHDLVHASCSDAAVPDSELDATSQELPLKLPKRPKAQKKKITIDEINEMHLAVLQNEQLKLDLEIENLHLKKQEIMLRIQELKSRSNAFSS